MLPASKHFTMVVGVDIHMTTLPPFNPLHPYVGTVMDVADYIPMLGSNTNVNNVPRGASDTSGMLATSKHIPIASGAFACMPMIGHESSNFYGAMNTYVEGSRFTPASYMIMTCADAGVPLSLKPGKRYTPIPSLYAPTSMSIPIPGGAPVILGGPYIPDFGTMMKNMAMGYGFGCAMKKAGSLLTKLNTKVLQKGSKPSKFKKALSKAFCAMGFEPVNLVTGAVQYEGTDFEFPGIIPLQWNRCWDSDSHISGLLGHGVSFCYDMRLEREREWDVIVVTLSDGRPASFIELSDGESTFNREEKLTLSRKENAYTLFNHEERLNYHFIQTDLNEPDVYRLASITNETGHAIRFRYINSRLSGITDTVGRELIIVSDKENRITQVKYAYGSERDLLVSYSYNEEGDLCGITDALGQTTVIEYKDHLMVKKTDRNGQAFYWEYKKIRGEQRCVHTWGDGGWLAGEIEYHKGYNLVTDSLGHVSRYDFTPEGYITSVTDPLGNTRTIQYTPEKDIHRVVDAQGNITGYSYNEQGQLTNIYYPDGGTQLYGYDKEGHINLTQSPEGRCTTFLYEDNLLKFANTPGGAVIAYEYNDKGLLTGIRSEGRKVTFTYDEWFNLSEAAINGEIQGRWWYDAYGRPLINQNGENKIRRWNYDALGRVVRDMLPDGNTVELTYDAYDSVLEAKDKQRKVAFAYTPLGSIKSREEDGKSVQFVYNTEDQLTAVINEHTERYSFGRNAAGQIVREMGFDGILRQYERNPLGLVSKVIRPGKREDTYEYNLQGQVSRIQRYDESWETFSYDRDGYLTEAHNPNSEIRIKRDPAGQVVEEWQDGHKVNSLYNKLGERIKVTSSLGADIDLAYNAVGYLERTKASQNASSPWEMKLKYNGIGQETERILTGGVESRWDYNLHGRPDYHTVTVGGRKTRYTRYRWGMNDRLLGMVNELTGEGTWFKYDQPGTLIEGEYPDGTKIFRVADSIGNLYKTAERKDRKYGAGGRLLEAEGTKFFYDDEGNLTEKIKGTGKRWRYQWYANGMLKTVIRPDFKTVSFEYDPLGRRTAKIYGEQITRWVWDGNTPLHEWKYAADDRPQTVADEFGFESKDKEEPVNNLITWVFEEGTFKPAAKITEEKQYSIITDYLGTPVQMYDEQGTLSWQAQLDVYGKVRTFEGSSLSDCPFRYQGQYEDEETGLYYNRFRYYSPEIGGYLSQDPIGLKGGGRLYGYVQDLNISIDSFGLDREHIIFLSDGGGVIPSQTTSSTNLHGIFTVDATGSYYDDRKALANAIGIDDPGKNWRAHHIDYDPKTNTMRMQFVHQDYHSYSHVGGADDFYRDTGFKYGSDEAVAEAAKRNEAKLKASCS